MAHPTPPPTTATFLSPSVSEGTGEIRDELPGLFFGELVRRRADLLEDDRHGPRLPVVIGDGEGDALPFLVHAEDDELPRFRFSCDPGGFYVHSDHGGIQNGLRYDFIHDLFRPRFPMVSRA